MNMYSYEYISQLHWLTLLLSNQPSAMELPTYFLFKSRLTVSGWIMDQSSCLSKFLTVSTMFLKIKEKIRIRSYQILFPGFISLAKFFCNSTSASCLINKKIPIMHKLNITGSEANKK